MKTNGVMVGVLVGVLIGSALTAAYFVLRGNKPLFAIRHEVVIEDEPSAVEAERAAEIQARRERYREAVAAKGANGGATSGGSAH